MENFNSHLCHWLAYKVFSQIPHSQPISVYTSAAQDTLYLILLSNFLIDGLIQHFSNVKL